MDSQDTITAPAPENPLAQADADADADASREQPSAMTSPTPIMPGHSQSSFATTAGMSVSSTPLGSLNAARKVSQSSMARGALNPDIAARMRAFHLERRNPPPPARPSPVGSQQQPSAANGSPHQTSASNMIFAGPGPVGGIPSNIQLSAGLTRPVPQAQQSAPSVFTTSNGTPPGRMSLAEKRGFKLPGGLSGLASPQPPSQTQTPAAAGAGRKKIQMSLADIHGPPTDTDDNSAAAASANSLTLPPSSTQSAMDRYSEYIDKETGSLKFKGKAILTNKGVEFASGQSFNISLDEVDTLDELGKGNYGTVYKVRHARPSIRRPGQGLAGNKSNHARHESLATSAPDSPSSPKLGSPTSTNPSEDVLRGPGPGRVMAMKELRLELEDSKFAAIIMELDVLHRCVSPYIVDFYGAFFQEGAVYICMEFMDGSIDKLYGDGIPENVLQKITLATTKGLRVLKDEHNIIHRDVKPTNILVNSLGAVKICDFGVSGNLVASIAKTNIGCQSYMAPERISSGGVAQAGAQAGGTYSVQSDIWSLGLTIIECALGRYPYPPETYDNVFSQLSAIVDGEPPDLPADKFSEGARNFVAGCLNKIPKLRPTYAMLLQHVWLAPLNKVETISEEDEEAAEEAADTLPCNTASEVGASTVDDEGQRWIDRDVGQWVREQLRKKREGRLGKHRSPALHAAPLDAASSSPSAPSARPPKPKNAGAVAV